MTAKVRARAIERELQLEASPEEVLRLWAAPAGGSGLGWSWGPDDRRTNVAVAIEPAARGSVVRVRETGFGKGRAWDRRLEEQTALWARHLAELFVSADGLRAKGKTVVLEQTVDAEPATVFRAVGSAEGLTRWFASGGTLDERPGGSYSLQAGPTRIEGVVREHVPGQAVSLTWNVQPCRARNLPTPTLVSFVLAPTDEGRTRITLVHSGFGDGPGWEGACEEHEQTWRWLFANVPTVLVHGIDRRKRDRAIERTLDVGATPERVFAALTDPAQLARWECASAALDPREGGAFRFTWTDALHAEGRVVAIEPGRKLELAYSVPAFRAGRPTLVSFGLEPRDGGTRLTLVHSGFDADPAWDSYYRGHVDAWDVDLEELVGLCERGDPGVVLRVEARVARSDALVRELEAKRARVRWEEGLVVALEWLPSGSPPSYDAWLQLLGRHGATAVRCGVD